MIKYTVYSLSKYLYQTLDSVYNNKQNTKKDSLPS